MTDIMELIDKYWDLAYKEGSEDRKHDTQNGDASKIRFQLESRISAMQEVVDAAVKNCTGIDCYCPLCEAIKKYKDELK